MRMPLLPSGPLGEKLARALLIGLACVAGLCLLLLLIPEPVFDALVRGPAAERPAGAHDLQLLEFAHERQPDAFILHVRARNISTITLERLQAVVTVTAAGGAVQTLVHPVEPPVLVPGREFAFTVQVAERAEAPVRRYAIFFQTPDGQVVPHRK